MEVLPNLSVVLIKRILVIADSAEVQSSPESHLYFSLSLSLSILHHHDLVPDDGSLYRHWSGRAQEASSLSSWQQWLLLGGSGLHSLHSSWLRVRFYWCCTLWPLPSMRLITSNLACEFWVQQQMEMLPVQALTASLTARNSTSNQRRIGWTTPTVHSSTRDGTICSTNTTVTQPYGATSPGDMRFPRISFTGDIFTQHSRETTGK